MASSETVIVRNGNGKGSKGRIARITPTFRLTQAPNQMDMNDQNWTATSRAGNPVADPLRLRTRQQDGCLPSLDRLNVLV
jgi:hypothetical protein